uniref:Uncharacterized protein n=1 Tax=Heterorhabditis bacteriophora TaxID=37862 RepID=A0A1I7XFS0_HETBA
MTSITPHAECAHKSHFQNILNAPRKRRSSSFFSTLSKRIDNRCERSAQEMQRSFQLNLEQCDGEKYEQAVRDSSENTLKAYSAEVFRCNSLVDPNCQNEIQTDSSNINWTVAYLTKRFIINISEDSDDDDWLNTQQNDFQITNRS